MTLARAHNRAFARGDHFTAGLIADYASLSGRDLDRTISEMTDAEIEALVSPLHSIAAAHPQSVDHSHGVAASAVGRESAR